MFQALIEQIAIAGGFIQRHVVLLIKFPPGEALFSGERMVASASGHVNVPHQRHKFKMRLQPPGKADAEIGLAAGDRLNDIACAAVDQLNAHARIAKPEAVYHVGHEIVGRRRHRGDGDQPGTLLADLIDIGQHRFDIHQQLIRTLGKSLPVQRQGHAPSGAIEQFAAQRVFQLFNPAAQRRLRQADRLRGQPKIAVLHQRAEGIKIVEIKIHGHSGNLSLPWRQRRKATIIAAYLAAATGLMPKRASPLSSQQHRPPNNDGHYHRHQLRCAAQIFGAFG